MTQQQTKTSNKKSTGCFIRLSPDEKGRLRMEAARRGLSLNAFVREVLRPYIAATPGGSGVGYDPDIRLGFFRLDRLGDLSGQPPEAIECLDCGLEINPDEGVWMCVMGDGLLVGPYCSLCAQVE